MRFPAYSHYALKNFFEVFRTYMKHFMLFPGVWRPSRFIGDVMTAKAGEETLLLDKGELLAPSTSKIQNLANLSPR